MGAAASTIPMQIDKATFRRLSGGTINDAIFDANSTNGIMSRDKLMELANMRDCLLSHDFGIDQYGRNVHERVMVINNALRAKGLITWYDEQKPTVEVVNHVTTAINRSRSIVCFFTKAYFEKVVGNFPTDHCHLEFGFTLSKKHPSLIIPVVMEEQVANPQTWPGNIGLALSTVSALNFIDDNNFEAKIEDLYQRIVKISRSNESQLKTTASQQHTSILSTTNKSREEQQFFQWLARSTHIDENRRLIYCASFVKAGVGNVFTLAKVMNENPQFLVSIGVVERDADEIALAVRDLGLGYNPVRNFNQALTIESVVYAMQKSSQSLEDPTLAESALNCVARVAASNPIMPSIMHDAGICEAVLKLMARNLSHAPSMEYGSLAVYNMAVNNPEIVEKFGSLTACDQLPRTLRSHTDNLAVVHNTCLAIAVLAANKDNRHKFSFTGTPDVLIKAIPKSIKVAEVVEKCFFAANRLSDTHLDNIGKLVVAGGCEAAVATLQTHPDNPDVMRQTFQLITYLAVEPNSRTYIGGQDFSCQAVVNSLNCQLEHPQSLIHGYAALSAIIMGNAFNRNCLGKAGACEVVKAGILKYPTTLDLLQTACKSVFALAAGSLELKQRFQGIQPILHAALSSRDVPEPIKADIKEAFLKVQ